MKLIDISKRIDKSKNNEDYVDSETISNEFNLDLYYVKQDKLKSYWIGNWCCTDTWVGYKMYFLDDEHVAVSSQATRKSDENIEWFSKELALKIRDYLLSLMIKEDEKFTIGDINEDIGEGYKINFNEQIINRDKAEFNGEQVKILEYIKETPNWGIDTKLKIELTNGEIREVEVEELDFRFNIV